MSMDLKQLSIEIMEMSSMGVKWTSGTHNQVTQVIYCKAEYKYIRDMCQQDRPKGVT